MHDRPLGDATANQGRVIQTSTRGECDAKFLYIRRRQE
jgi:hypothetical protein